MITLRRILVPVDFSSYSRAALEWALTLAQPFGARVDLLHVWATPDYTSPEMFVELPGEARQTLAGYAEKRAEVAMNSFLADFPNPGNVPIETRLESGDATSTIVNVATEGFYDLVVMGTHGRTGLSHLVMGSVAEKVARTAPCGVLVVRAEGKAPSRDNAQPQS
jgi:universal stress protein A